MSLFEGMTDDAMFEAAALAATKRAESNRQRRYRVSQHIGWIKMYAGVMSSDNWRDMCNNIEDQIAQLSEELKQL